MTVISGKNNTVFDPIHVGSYPIGIVFDSANGNLYVTNFYNVSVISGKNNTVVGGPITVLQKRRGNSSRETSEM